MKRNVDCSQHRDAWSEENDKLIDRVYKDRMKTTYQVSYYRRYPYTGEERAAEETEDEFLKEMEICYKRSTEERLAPQVPATRPGFAYGLPAFFSTGISEYKDSISRVAYYIFQRDKNAGINRLDRYKRPTASRATLLADQSSQVPRPTSGSQAANARLEAEEAG
ncbi:uncharacterized protein LOC111862642 isoform X2 [Cryptotermes secundus]|uniref:uncharacterized protein LOC111862642 isoform X2 n=1 Tax=Cryptotermes secundus TaxID=105785 RepID=UPI000CD7DD04|nr:uncharacterized protein LOC111862642 isoform X2 [Cryptotermes secundus]